MKFYSTLALASLCLGSSLSSFALDTCKVEIGGQSKIAYLQIGSKVITKADSSLEDVLTLYKNNLEAKKCAAPLISRKCEIDSEGHLILGDQKSLQKFADKLGAESILDSFRVDKKDKTKSRNLCSEKFKVATPGLDSMKSVCRLDYSASAKNIFFKLGNEVKTKADSSLKEIISLYIESVDKGQCKASLGTKTCSISEDLSFVFGGQKTALKFSSKEEGLELIRELGITKADKVALDIFSQDFKHRNACSKSFLAQELLKAEKKKEIELKKEEKKLIETIVVPTVKPASISK
jgi:hypothetical protein